MPWRAIDVVAWVLPFLALVSGCQTVPKSGRTEKSKEVTVQKSVPAQAHDSIPHHELPKELNKTSLPPYVAETPDVLVIQATRLVPLPPYTVQPLDQLRIVVQNSLGLANPEARINGIYPVNPDGTISLGRDYGGAVRVIDLSTQDVEKLLTRQLAPSFVEAPRVSVSLATPHADDNIRGEHAIKSDGTIRLGTYGDVHVAGQTLPQIKAAIETHLAKFLFRPAVSVDVKTSRSKFYYVIADHGGAGEIVVRQPATGNETVLDAVSQGVGQQATSIGRIWIARPVPAGTADQILPVDWAGISQRGHTNTNYQILPGDRVYITGKPHAATIHKSIRSVRLPTWNAVRLSSASDTVE